MLKPSFPLIQRFTAFFKPCPKIVSTPEFFKKTIIKAHHDAGSGLKLPNFPTTKSPSSKSQCTPECA